MITNAKEIVGGKRVDSVLLSLYFSLVGVGLLMIYAVGYKQGYTTDWGEFMLKPIGKQFIALTVAILLALIIFSIDEKFWRVFAYPIYGMGLLGLVLVLFLGKEINGAKAWFVFGGFSFQPAEIAKLGTALAISSYLSTPSISLRENRTVLTVLGILAFPMLLIILQPDAGSMLVFLSFSILLYREGLSPVPYIIGFILLLVFILAIYFGDNSGELIMYLMMLATGIFTFNVKQGHNLWLSITGVIAALALWLFFARSQQWGLSLMTAIVLFYIIVFSRRGRFKIVLLTGSALFVSIALIYSTNFMFSKLKPHQRDRIWVWLRPDKVDPRGAAYNLINSKMAIGSGGFLGKGFTEGTMTKLNFVPEQQTDFIFCTIGEEQGFVGAFAVVVLYMIFLVRIVQVAERQRSNFVRLYAYALAGIFFIHFFINIGMTMGLLPVIGIPLPFISAGGSSLLGFTAMLAILLKLDSNRYSV